MSGSINAAEATHPTCAASASLLAIGPLIIAIAAFCSVRGTLDGVGESPHALPGPGLTFDEIFNLQAGVYLWRSLVHEGPVYFTLAGAERVRRNPQFNPDHPPLGRWLIGLCHDLQRGPPPDGARPDLRPPYSLIHARTASAVAFALTVFLVGWFAGRQFGPLAGWLAALAMPLMPRLFAHAHLAALETSMGLTFTATVLYVAARWRPDAATTPAIPWRAVCLAGLLFGLALLTKIQAVLLPVPIALWCLWYWRWRGVPMLAVFGLVGALVFVAGWPWLWLDPVGHLREYLGRAAHRPTLYCFYLGQRYADLDVPWHYPYVLFLVTVPLGLQVLGAMNLWPRRAATNPDNPATENSAAAQLLAGGIVWVLTVFALPGVTVYDGERLFLVVFPLWAVLIGRGGSRLYHHLKGRGSRRGGAIAVALLTGSSLGSLVALHPCQLSYYNLLTGGLRGANRLGFEPTYWRDSVTRELLTELAAAVPEGATVYVAPVLHPANLIDLPLLSPILQQHRLRLDSYDDRDPSKAGMRYVLVIRRHADPWDSLEPAPAGAQLLAEVRREGVQLAAVYDLKPDRAP